MDFGQVKQEHQLIRFEFICFTVDKSAFATPFLLFHSLFGQTLSPFAGDLDCAFVIHLSFLLNSCNVLGGLIGFDLVDQAILHSGLHLDCLEPVVL